VVKLYKNVLMTSSVLLLEIFKIALGLIFATGIKLYKSLQSVFNDRYSIVEACLVAVVLTIAIFPDIIFLDASLRLTDQVVGAERPDLHAPLRPFYPVANHIGWWAGYNDNGGAISQSEPMIEFMRYCFANAESPYWNPYSAAGSLGPESLIDQKFSAFTLINAGLGGGTDVYNNTLLSLYFFAIFFLFRVAREHLKLSVLAGIGLSLFYILNGYSVANFGSNVTQSYLYVPMCLFASISFLEKSSTAKFVAIVFSFAVFLSCTFVPTTVTSFIAIYVIIIGYILARISQRELNYRSATVLIALQCTGVLASILLLAPLYFPILENIKSVGTVEDYSNRIFFALKFPQAIASIFSPSHLYESYNAMEAAAISWHDVSSVYSGITGNTVFHQGVTAIALTGCAFSRIAHKYCRLIIVCILCAVFGFLRLFEPPIVAGLISYVPIVGKIGCQYWWPVVMLPTTFLIGFGLDNLARHSSRIWPALMLLVMGVAAIFYVYKIYGFGEPAIEFKLAALLLLSVLTTIITALLLTLRFSKNINLTKIVVLSLVMLMFVELMVDGKMIRAQRNDLFSTLPDAVAYVHKNANLYRTLNFGATGLYQELGPALQIQEITSRNQGVLLSYLDYFYSAIDLDNSQRPSYNSSISPRGSSPTLQMIKDNPSSNKINWAALDLLGVKYILLPVNFPAYKTELIQQELRLVYETPATLVFENPNVLPRAFEIGLSVDKLKPTLTLPADFREHIHPTTISSYHNAAVEIKGTASSEMLVVLSDNWHQNWHATMNGIDVPIIKVNGTLRGVAVPKGEYVIKMNYRPHTLPLAISISLGVLFLLIVMLFARRRLDQFIHCNGASGYSWL